MTFPSLAVLMKQNVSQDDTQRHLNSQIQQTLTEQNVSLQRTITKTDTQIQTLTAKNTSLIEKEQALHRTIAETEISKNVLKTQIQTLTEQNASLQLTIAENGLSKNLLKTQIQTLSVQNARTIAETEMSRDMMKTQVQTLTAQNTSLIEKEQALQRTMDALQLTIDERVEGAMVSQAEKEALQAELKEAREIQGQSAQSFEKEVKATQAEREAFQASLTALHAELKESRESQSQGPKIDELKNVIHLLRSVKTALGERTSELHTSQRTNESLQAELKESRETLKNQVQTLTAQNTSLIEKEPPQ